ncbi:MAG: pitrilysin family protein [Thermodesulfovibrionales bacterium]
MFVKKHLENGIPVVMEPLRNVRSVALGVWVKVGSRYERPDENGISHFLEHMFFKGTKRRTAKAIAVEIDSMGGDLNAFTSREHTAFYVKVLDEYLERGADLLADVFMNPLFPEEEVEKEKKIIKEEIKMVEDTPDDYIHDLFSQTVWGQEGLGQPILGRRETIARFTRDDIMSHIRKYYGTRDVMISCAGNFSPDELVALLNERFGSLRRGSETRPGHPPEFHPALKVASKDLSEAHLCIGVPAIAQTSEDRYGLFVLNAILGGSVSSRLFQEIRESRGLAYSVYSFTSLYLDTGLWGVYAGVSRKKTREVAELAVAEMRSLFQTISEDELEMAKQQLKGNIILGLESTNSRMNNIARQEIYFNRYISPEEIMRSVEKVTLHDARELAARLTGGPMAMTALGPVERETLDGVL